MEPWGACYTNHCNGITGNRVDSVNRLDPTGHGHCRHICQRVARTSRPPKPLDRDNLPRQWPESTE